VVFPKNTAFFYLLWWESEAGPRSAPHGSAAPRQLHRREILPPQPIKKGSIPQEYCLFLFAVVGIGGRCLVQRRTAVRHHGSFTAVKSCPRNQ
jgi:hypothetical protein